jgi:hypothetical protein
MTGTTGRRIVASSAESIIDLRNLDNRLPRSFRITEWKPPTLLCTPVEDYVHGLAGEDMLQVCGA